MNLHASPVKHKQMERNYNDFFAVIAFLAMLALWHIADNIRKIRKGNKL
jgi:hypothetical protein